MAHHVSLSCQKYSKENKDSSDHLNFQWHRPIPFSPSFRLPLGALGLAGIFRETSRVVHRAILPNFANLGLPYLSALLLATAMHARDSCDSGLRDGSTIFRLVADWVNFFILELIILGGLLCCTGAYVLCVASLYRTGGDLLAAHRVIRERLPVVTFRRLAFTFLLVVVPYLVFFSSLFALAYLRLEIKIVLPLRVLGWGSAAYVAVVGQLAWVVSALEDAALFSAIRRSRDLLAGKFWAAACVFVTLDGCIIAVLKAFPTLMLDDALGLGVWFKVPAGVAMFVALYAVLVVALVAQPVVYMVCKSHHQLEIIDKAHQEPSTATIKGVKLQIETAQ